MASTFTTTLGPSRGFHPTFRTVISLPNGSKRGGKPHQDKVPDEYSFSDTLGDSTNCTLHIAHTLPSGLFVDPYELELRHEEYTFKLWGERNLEHPVHSMTGASQNLLLNVTVSPGMHEVVVEVPAHLRYAEPGHGGHKQVTALGPLPFWACPTSGPGGRRQGFTAPHRLPEHVDAYFGLPFALQSIPGAVAISDGGLTVDVPVGNLDHLSFVDVGTALTILLCFVYLTTTCIRAARCLDACYKAEKVKAE